MAVRSEGSEVWDQLGAFLTRAEPRPTTRCGNVRCEPGWHWKVELTDFDLWLAVAGQGSFRLGAKRYDVRPGTLFWLRPGDQGLATQDPANPLMVIFAHFSFVDAGSSPVKVVQPDLLPSRHIPLRDPARVEPLLARVVHLMQLPAPLSIVEATSLLRVVIAEAYRQDAANLGALNIEVDRRVARVLQKLYRHPARRFTLQDVATAVELSPDHFSRLFRAETGTSFRQYCVDVRLDRARQLLEETTMSVTEIAHALGYDDIFCSLVSARPSSVSRHHSCVGGPLVPMGRCGADAAAARLP